MIINKEIEAYLPLDYPSVSGIIANVSKGLVWADYTHMPGIYVAYSYCVGGCGIVGDLTAYSDEEIKNFFEKIFSDFRSEGEDSFEFSTENQGLYARILDVFKEKEIDSEIEYSFIGKNKCEEKIAIPEGVSIQLVDHNLIEKMENGSIKNGKMFSDRFMYSWKDEESFLANSASFVAIIKDTIVGVIFGSATYERRVAIDIEVAEEYRRKKIARRLTVEMLNYLVDRGYELQWDCTESNENSRRVAQSMGFEQIRARPYYWFKI